MFLSFPIKQALGFFLQGLEGFVGLYRVSPVPQGLGFFVEFRRGFSGLLGGLGLFLENEISERELRGL